MVNGSAKREGGQGFQVETANWKRNQGPERKGEELKKERMKNMPVVRSQTLASRYRKAVKVRYR